jgi:hypothetical protein
VRHDDTAAIEGLEDQPHRGFFDQCKPPVEKKLAAAWDVLGPKGDFIDTENAHDVSLVKQRFQIETFN